MKYNENTIDSIFKQNLDDANQRLASLSIADGSKPNIGALNGWIYEQTIRHCLLDELREIGQNPTIAEQVHLEGRIKIDLLIKNIAVELKLAGSFGKDASKYSSYRIKAGKKGWMFYYLTRQETYEPYRSAIINAIGKECTFFLDVKGDWQRFVKAVAEKL